MRTNSNEKDFDLHDNGLGVGIHFHMNGFARRLVLKQRQRVTRIGLLLRKTGAKRDTPDSRSESELNRPWKSLWRR